jgi:uncharacterized membrane protein YdjX (TVP38/TMEM64 family)
MRKNFYTKLLLVLLLGAAIMAFFVLDAGRFFTLEYVQSQRQSFVNFYAEHQILTIAMYFAIYVIVTALSLPGAAIMTLAGGGVFGLLIGTVVVSFASTIGATLAFLVSRFLLREYVQQRFAEKLGAVNRGIDKEGAFYLFTMRLIPIFPFFVINLVMGLTPIKTLQFFFVSQIGMLAGTIVYVNAGSQLASIDSVGDILSPSLLLSFALLGVFPLVAKKLVEFVKARKLPQKPQSADRP